MSNRRNFIQKFAALTSGAFFASKAAFSASKLENELGPTVSNIKPLGFQWETRDPFLFCVHHEDAYPKGNGQMGPAASLEGRHMGQDFIVKDGWRMYHGMKIPGFPGHPHRGFETITVVREGMVDHSDSLGAAGRYGNGDVQWMTAGKGVQHSEMFPLLSDEKDNPMELFQIWLNLPKANKMVEPHFKMLWGEDIPKYEHADQKGLATKVEVIVGQIERHKAPAPPPDSWAANAINDVAIWNIEMEPGASWVLPKANAGVNRRVYFFNGDTFKIDGVDVPHYHSADVLANAHVTFEAGAEKTNVLVLQGRPINEPVVQHGPFVMNSRQEIQQAFKDYQETKFGGWPWPELDHVHAKKEGRFALHADGRRESKS
ncbi:MAG: pirin family protein [Flavobacteriales bacterium]|nr:pirin family protein [Flavobacteriales bacterium]MDG2246455.1 pirin family protein [Flavobacteriales bacterium]